MTVCLYARMSVCMCVCVCVSISILNKDVE